MIFKTREGYEDWVGVQTHGETEYFRRKKIEQRQRRNTVAEREKRDEQYRLMLLRQEREDAERRRMEEVHEQERRKNEASRNVSVRSYSSGYNRGSSYRTPASICSRTSSQIVRLRDPPSEPSIRYFRSDFSLIGSPADRNRYGRMLPLKLKLMVTLMFNPAGIQMRYNFILSFILIIFAGTFQSFTITFGMRHSHIARHHPRNQMKSCLVIFKRFIAISRSPCSMRRI